MAIMSPRIAFVGSGGAARGIAHLGVLRACEELRIVPEIFVGASAGAIVASTYGQGMDLDVLLDGYRLPWKRRHHDGLKLHFSSFFGLPRPHELLQPGHLLTGLASIHKFEKTLERHLPNNDFRKLEKSIFVTAVDIDTAERVVFGPGYSDNVPISKAVAASCCVPGLFRPYRIGDRYYIDGEVARTLSADLAVSAGADIVIISNIYQPSVLPHVRSVAHQGAAAVLRQSLNIMLTEKERRGVQYLTTLYPSVTFIDIAPDIGHLSYLNRFQARELMDRGYQKALRTLVEAKERGIFDPLPAGRIVN